MPSTLAVAPLSSASGLSLPLAHLRTFCLAALSGALYAASYPPSHVWPLAFVSWAPLLVALSTCTPRQAALVGLLQGFVTQAITLYWLPPVVHTFGGAGPAVCFAVSALVWLYGALAVALPSWLAVRASVWGLPQGFAFAFVLAATEALFPVIFPSYTAVQVHSFPLLMQLADVGGPVLVGVPLVLANVAVAEGVLSLLGSRRPSRIVLLLGLLAPLAAAIYGLVRMRTIDGVVRGSPPVQIGIVQANTPHKKMGLRTAVRTYRSKTAALPPELDLVVWPETALSAVIPRDGLETVLREQLLHTPEFPDAPPFPVLSGAMLGRGAELSNSALLVRPDGTLGGTYDKVHPLAFGEYVPFADVFPFLDRLIPNAGHLTPGRVDQQPLMLAGHRITPLICYEDVVPKFTDEAVQATNGELLVDLTNDSWFGATTASAMHLGVAKFRAIEHRRYLVHAATTGISAFVDPEGRVVAESEPLADENLIGAAHFLSGGTLYERIGSWPRCLLGAFALAAVVFGRRHESA